MKISQETYNKMPSDIRALFSAVPNPERDEVTGLFPNDAQRFFYCAKASRSERNAGLEGTNHHPTIKPLALMRYLARLTKTPTGGVVLDPFMGSGTTGMAAVLEGRDFIGIELNPEYLEIAERRIKDAQLQMPLFEKGEK